MSDNKFVYSFVFRANTAEAKAAVADFNKEVAGATGSTAGATAAVQKNTAIVDQGAAAQIRLGRAYGQNRKGVKRLDPILRRNATEMRLSGAQADLLAAQMGNVGKAMIFGGPVQGSAADKFKALKLMMVPTRLALGATAGALIVGAKAWDGYLVSTKAVATASAGLGRATAGTAAEMEAAARAGAAAAGISMKAARAMQVQFLRTGTIGSENFEAMIALSKDFAVTMGVGADAAGGALAKMFADPAKAADVLYHKYGLIDGATARHAANLARQNRQTEAQTIILSDLSGKLADATDATTGWARAWDKVKTAAADASDAVGDAVDGVFSANTLDEQIAEARAAVEANKNQSTGGILGGFLSSTADRDVERAQKELDRLLALQAKAKAESARETAARKGAKALTLAQKSPANADAMREEQLRNDLAALQLGQNAPDQDAEQRRRIAVAIDATTTALNGLIGRKERVLELDRLAIQIQNERNPLMRAELEARRTRLQMSAQEMTADKIATEAARAYNRVINETIASAATQAADLQADLIARQRLNVLVASGAITADDANRMLSEELVLRPLITAAAAAEGAEKLRLLNVIEALKTGYAGLATEQRHASGQAFLRGQQETLEKLRIEASLLGINATNRARILALLEAELEIRYRGLDVNSRMANDLRSNALRIANERRELEKQAQAWDKVQSAAEGAIDTMTDDLLRGDFSGALDSLAQEITGMFAEIAIKNPLKNAILGTDFGTINDIGGLQGIWSRLTGQGAEKAGGLRSSISTKSTGTMNVTAASVIINASGLLGDGAANINGAGGLGGNGAVQQQIWDFFKGKGLPAHQIAGIMGNVSAESGFNPLARGDGGAAYGLFQHNDRSGKLLSHIGGAGNLGDIKGQLEFVWKELMSTEAAAMKRLRASTDVRGATGAFVGFERPQGYSVQNPAGSMHWDRRLAAAETALSKFGNTAGTATQTLGTLGSGFDTFGSFLSKVAQGATSQGGDVGLFGMLAKWVGGALGIKGFKIGGATGGSDPAQIAGVVHEKEYVFDAAATARIGVPALEAMRKGAARGYRSGGYATIVSSGANAMPAAVNNNAPAPVNFTVHNYSGQPIEQEETTDASGGRQITMTIGEHMAGAMAQPGNAFPKKMEQRFAIKRRGVAR